MYCPRLLWKSIILNIGRMEDVTLVAVFNGKRKSSDCPRRQNFRVNYQFTPFSLGVFFLLH